MQLSTPIDPGTAAPREEQAPAVCTRLTTGCLTWVRVADEVDLRAVPGLTEALRFPLGDFPLIVMVDMRGATFIDASAAHVLLDASDAVRATGGRLVVIRGAVELDWWFSVIGLDDRIEVTDVRAGRDRTSAHVAV